MRLHRRCLKTGRFRLLECGECGVYEGAGGGKGPYAQPHREAQQRSGRTLLLSADTQKALTKDLLLALNRVNPNLYTR